jgi:hypothetical protein
MKQLNWKIYKNIYEKYKRDWRVPAVWQIPDNAKNEYSLWTLLTSEKFNMRDYSIKHRFILEHMLACVLSGHMLERSHSHIIHFTWQATACLWCWQQFNYISNTLMLATKTSFNTEPLLPLQVIHVCNLICIHSYWTLWSKVQHITVHQYTLSYWQ